MAETIAVGDRRLLAWDVGKDMNGWTRVLGEQGGVMAQAFLSFSRRMHESLTAFIAELRPGEQQQLLRPYSYELPRVAEVMVNGEAYVEGLDRAHTRAHAMTLGVGRVHQHFQDLQGRDNGAQAVLMSPVSETRDEPEFQYTAVYLQTLRDGHVEAWQLFIDLNHEKRQAFMRWMAGRQGQSYELENDLDLAANPVLLDEKRYSSIEAFMTDIAAFLDDQRVDTPVARRITRDPVRFVQDQQGLEKENAQEAREWVDGYVRAIAQGSIELGKRIITQLQMKILGVTESMVRTAAREIHLDVAALQTFLRACGFLEFTFSESGGLSPLSGIEALASNGERVKCPVCSSRAKHDVYVHCAIGAMCPGCGHTRPC